MKSKELVSIIMPAYNASAYISDAVNSIVNQTYAGWELIIIDDGSTDSTAKKLQPWLELDSRVHYYYQDNGKQGKARNLGISKSKGKYLAFLDADDLWLPEKLEIQIEEIQENNVDLVFSNSYIFNNANIFDRSTKMHTFNQIFKGEEALKLFLKGNRVPILTVLAKKEKVLLVNGFSEKLIIQNAEDYHLWLKMLISGCVFYGSDKTLASYRVHSESSTSQDKMASKQLPEVFFDLSQNNPEVKLMFLNVIKEIFRKKYNCTVYTKSDFYFVIDQNCRYLKKDFYSPFYKIINYFLGIKITKKFLNHLLNA